MSSDEISCGCLSIKETPTDDRISIGKLKELIGAETFRCVDLSTPFCPDLILGSHITFDNKNSGLYGALSRGRALNFSAVQIYLGSQQGYARSTIKEADIKSAQDLCQEQMNFFTHCSLSYNLAGSVTDKTLAWSSETPEQKSRDLEINKWLTYELSVVGRVNANGNGGVVIHPGTYPDAKEGLVAIVRSIDKIDFPPNSYLVLENSSGSKKGSKLAEDFDQLATIINSSKNKDHLKVCIDTAHIFGAGLYDIHTIEGVNAMFSDFDKKIGKSKLGLIHLNDSEAAFNSKLDRHAVVGKGLIWTNNWLPLHYLLYQCKLRGVPLVLENSFESIYYIKEVEDKYKGYKYL